MKVGYTEIIFVIDRSGSMDAIASDIVGGLNALIKEQREKLVNAICKVSAYKFDDVYETIFENQDLATLRVMTLEDFQPRGMTALYDAVGTTIDNVGVRLHNTPEEERPERVLVVVITDGLNNASVKFTAEQVKEKIQHQTQVYSWDFAYIGANQDSWTVGGNLGYSQGTTLDYVADSAGVEGMFDKLSKSTLSYRAVQKKACFAFEPDAPPANEKVD